MWWSASLGEIGSTVSVIEELNRECTGGAKFKQRLEDELTFLKNLRANLTQLRAELVNVSDYGVVNA